MTSPGNVKPRPRPAKAIARQGKGQPWPARAVSRPGRGQLQPWKDRDMARPINGQKSPWSTHTTDSSSHCKCSPYHDQPSPTHGQPSLSPASLADGESRPWPDYATARSSRVQPMAYEGLSQIHGQASAWPDPTISSPDHGKPSPSLALPMATLAHGQPIS
jgi:hypothetical protein